VKAFGTLVIALGCLAAACSSASVGELRPDPQAGSSGLAQVPISGTSSNGDGEQKARSSETTKESFSTDLASRCPKGMVDIDGRFCIDKYEASLVEVLPNGEERAFSPYSTVDGRKVRAVSVPNVPPQGYISAFQAHRACVASGKRLCLEKEWKKACRGPEKRAYGYGDRREPGRCNDRGKNPVMTLFNGRYTSSTMNQPDLNQMEGTLAKTGEHAGCTNGYGVYDMVGNLHEWVADANGTFHGGYYQDVSSFGHGEGCGYVTTAHEGRYHDYSTGFRCCADLPGANNRTKR
jgi:formylglycine-generating enzyme